MPTTTEKSEVTASREAGYGRNLLMRLRNDRFVVALALITAGGVGLRVAYVVWMMDRPVLGDGFAYHLGAIYLAEGYGFINPLLHVAYGTDVQDATHPPAWTAVLATPSALGVQSFLSHQLFASAIGATTVFMTGLAGRAVLWPRTGLVAAALVAIYPGAWLYERELLSEPLVMLGVATMLWLVYTFRNSPGPALAVALGVMAALLAMTRSELILTAVFVVVPVILSARDLNLRRRVLWLFSAGLACVVIVAPWAIYNATRFERPVPLSTGLGPAMMTGNCPRTYDGELLGYYEFGCLTILVRDRAEDPSIIEDRSRRKAIGFMRDNTSRVPVVAAARVGRTFNLFRPFQQVHLEAERGTEPWVLRTAMFSYWALLPLAVFGAVIARRRRVPIYPLLAFPAIVMLAVLPTIGAVRYRAPAEISLVILAAVTIDVAVESWKRRRSLRNSPMRLTEAQEAANTGSPTGAVS